MTPVTRSRTVKPVDITPTKPTRVKGLKPAPRPEGWPTSRERMREMLKALEGPTPRFTHRHRETRDERLRACYYLIVNMMNVKESMGSAFPIFRLGVWTHSPKKSRCCGHRIAKDMPYIAVLEEHGHVRWVVHYDCFKKIVDIRQARFANRMIAKHKDMKAQEIFDKDFGVHENTSELADEMFFNNLVGRSAEILGNAVKMNNIVPAPDVIV